MGDVVASSSSSDVRKCQGVKPIKCPPATETSHFCNNIQVHVHRECIGKLGSSPFCCFSLLLVTSIFSIALCFGNRASVFLFLDFTRINGVEQDPLTQLPSSTTSNSSSYSSTIVYIHDFGAKGNGIQDDTEAFQEAWKVACSLSSKAKLVVPDGKTFLISDTIVAPKDPAIWVGLNPKKWLYFYQVNYLTIEGGGTIDVSGQEWWARSCKIDRTNAMTFHKCKNVIVRNIMSINSQHMHMVIRSCEQIVLSYLRIFAPAHSPNTDGIHISASKNVEVKDCIIRTGVAVSLAEC